MSQKRFCDHCDKEIKEDEFYIQLNIAVLTDKNNGTIWKGDNCIECAKNGLGLVDIMKSHTND